MPAARLPYPCRARGRAGRTPARALRRAAGRMRGHLLGQWSAVSGGAARHPLVRRHLGARQLQAACARAGLRACRQRRARGVRVCGAARCGAGCGRRRRGGAGVGGIRLGAGGAGRAAGAAGARSRRRGLAVLHLGHHRAAQGRDADAPQPAGHDHGLLHRRGRRAARRRHGLCRAHVAWRGLVQLRPHAARRAPRGARVRWVRPGRAGAIGRGRGPPVAVCRAHHGAPAGGARAPHGRQCGRLQDHRLRRRSHVCGRPAPRHRHHGPEVRADLWPGRKPHDHHRAGARAPGRHGAPALGRAHRLGRRGACVRTGAGGGWR